MSWQLLYTAAKESGTSQLPLKSGSIIVTLLAILIESISTAPKGRSITVTSLAILIESISKKLEVVSRGAPSARCYCFPPPDHCLGSCFTLYRGGSHVTLTGHARAGMGWVANDVFDELAEYIKNIKQKLQHMFLM